MVVVVVVVVVAAAAAVVVVVVVVEEVVGVVGVEKVRVGSWIFSRSLDCSITQTHTHTHTYIQHIQHIDYTH